MEIEKSLDEAAALISKCWDLKNNPNDLGVCRVQIQTLVSDMIEQSQTERGAFPVTEQVIQKLSDLFSICKIHILFNNLYKNYLHKIIDIGIFKFLLSY